MSQPGHATDWQSTCIPPTIRRPWNVWENFLEDHVAEASSQAEELSPDIREQIASVQAKGAKMAFMLLDEAVQQQYVEVSCQELAAFANWRRSQVAQQESGALPPATEFEGCWDLLNHDDKKEWLPQDPKAFLAADLQWAALVTNPLCQEAAVKKPFKGEKEQSKKVPVKGEAKKTAQVEAPKVKEEPGSKDPQQKAPKEKAVVVKQEKQPASAQPPEKERQQEAPKDKAKPVQKEKPKEKAVVVKQEKRPASAQPPEKERQQEAPKDKAKPVQKEKPKEKAVVVKQEKQPASAAKPQKEVPKDPKEKAKAVQPEVSKEKAIVVKHEKKQTAPAQPQKAQEAPKNKAKPQKADLPQEAVEVKKEPVQTSQAKPQKADKAEKEKEAPSTSSAVVAADKEVPSKDKAVRAKKTKASEPRQKAKAKTKAVSLEQRLRKKKNAVSDDEAEDDNLKALVPRSDDEDDAKAAQEISKASATRKDAARSAPPGRMLVNRQYRAPPKEVQENLFPEALEAVCCKCNDGSVAADNDLGICDRCDKAFHQKCHAPQVTYFGNPEDQWFCSQCTLELAEMRKLQLKARVLRIDFSSLADPKPYWVQFFDAGPPEGAWVGEIHVKPWSDGPSFRSIVQARRRNAVRLAEADGATQISTEERAPASRRKRPQDAVPANSRRQAAAEESPEKRPRRSRRGEANVSLLTEPNAKRSKAVSECRSPKPKRRQDFDPNSTEKQRRVDQQAQSKIDETCNLIAQLKEHQRQVDQELAQQAAV